MGQWFDRAFAVGAGYQSGVGLCGKGPFRVQQQVSVQDIVHGPDRFHPPDFVEERSLGVDAQSDEVEEFLQSVYPGALGDPGLGEGLLQQPGVGVDVAQRRVEYGFAAQMLTDLPENPGVANGRATDHEAVTAGFPEHPGRFPVAGYVSVGQYRAGERGDGVPYVVVVDLRPVEFPDGPAVQAEQIHFVFPEEFQQTLEGGRIVEPDAGLYGEAVRRMLAQQCEYLVDVVQRPQEPAPDVLLVDLGSGASQIEVDAGDGVGPERLHRALEVLEVFPEELSEYGSRSRIVGDGVENVLVRNTGCVHPEVLGEIVVRGSETVHHLHEFPGRDVLHGSQRRGRLALDYGIRQSLSPTGMGRFQV